MADATLYLTFLSGILASFSPCVAVLIPMLFYRFTRREDGKILSIALFSVSFVVTFVLSALFLSALFSSTVKNGFQLGLGMMFAVVGILDLAGKLDAMRFPLVKNPVLLGVSFALLSAVNPCSFSYLGIVIATVRTSLWLHLLFFSMGVLVPAMAFLVVGDRLFSLVTKPGRVMEKIGKGMSAVLVVIGVYLVLTIKQFGLYDAWVTALMLGVLFFIMMRAICCRKDIASFAEPHKLLLIASLILILFTTVYHCSAYTSPYGMQRIPSYADDGSPSYSVPQYGSLEAGHTCNMFEEECVVCKRCIRIFSAALVSGAAGIILSYLFAERMKNSSTAKKKKHK
ncbi:hypothetical protein D6764_05280 [Candidatus Woesearchaeota archaeon]|nr:MAG: hypothetical protein D6764_05280 [Candidatus Woesearchaeota archaeon]